MADELSILAIIVGGLASAGYLAHRFHLTPALGYLGMGILAGMSTQVQNSHVLLEGINHVGILVLLFAIGLELDLKRLRSSLSQTAFTLPFDLAVPALLVASVFRMLGWSVVECVAIGLAVALSSTLFGERLTSTPKTTAATRQRVIGVLLAEDVAAGALLAIIATMGGASQGWAAPIFAMGQLIFLFVLLAAGALLIIPRILDHVAKTHQHELVVLTSLGSIIAFGALGYYAQSAELGALLAGVAAAEAGSRFVVRNSLQTFRGLAIALVFFATGTHVEAGAVAANMGPALMLAGTFLAAKLMVHVPSALGRGMSLDESLRTGFALGTIGEFSIIMVAAAESAGIAHPLLSTTVVGALLVLLIVSGILSASTPWFVRQLLRTPRHVQRPLKWLVQGISRSPDKTPSEIGRRRQALRLLISNVLLLVAWIILSGPLADGILRAMQIELHFAGEAIMIGLTLAVAAPLAVGAYRAYRDLVWQLVGLREGERVGAGKARMRVVDAWIVGTVVLVLIPVTLALPRALPVLLGSVLIAIMVASLAWRQLAGFHRALEGSVQRVLGQDEVAGELLDRAMGRYPWGVRFSAVSVPKNSPVVGATIDDSGISRLTGALIAVLQRKQKEMVNPSHDEVILGGDTLVLMGDVHQLTRAETLIVSHGEALRMTALSHQASLQEVAVEPTSSLLQMTLGQADVRANSGALVVGIWPEGSQHPKPYTNTLRLEPGDRLILLGTPLQVERARVIAQGLVDIAAPE